MKDRYIRASELATFSFCERAWHLERKGAQSALQKERAEGSADHQRQNAVLESALMTERASSLLLILGCVGLAIAAAILVLSR
jgi:hypothetical protein